MPQPPSYLRQYDFSDYQSNYPDDPLPGNQVDNEFDAVKATLDQIRLNLALIQKDDGSLKNESVGMNQVAQDLLLYIASGLDFKGDWVTATAYAVGDVVGHTDGATYVCTGAHTSGTFITDRDTNDYWLLMANPANRLGTPLFDKFNGDGSTTTFTLSQALGSERQALFFVGGEFQSYDALSVTGDQLTFTSPPPSGTDNVLVVGADTFLQQISVDAAASAAAAATSESNAAGHVATALGHANTAASEASDAAASASAAATSETNAAASYDEFDDRFLGSKASDPVTDNDGDPLVVGAIYFNNVNNELRVWNGSSWQDPPLYTVPDNSITLPKLAHGTANTLIGFNGSGAPAEVAIPASGGTELISHQSFTTVTDVVFTGLDDSDGSTHVLFMEFYPSSGGNAYIQFHKNLTYANSSNDYQYVTNYTRADAASTLQGLGAYSGATQGLIMEGYSAISDGTVTVTLVITNMKDTNRFAMADYVGGSAWMQGGATRYLRSQHGSVACWEGDTSTPTDFDGFRIVGCSAGTMDGTATLVKVKSAAAPAAASFNALEIVESVNVSTAVSEVEFLTGIEDGYAYHFVYDGISPSIDNESLLMELTTDGGVTYDTGFSDYSLIRHFVTEGSTTESEASTTFRALFLGVSIGNNVNEGVSGVANLYNLSDSNFSSRVRAEAFGINGFNGSVQMVSQGARKNNAAHNGFRVKFGSGNITKGRMTLYRYKH